MSSSQRDPQDHPGWALTWASAGLEGVGVFGGDTSPWGARFGWGGHAGSLSGAMGVLGGCVPLSSIPIPSVTAHRREVIPQACPTSPAPLPTQGHPRQGRASAHPSLQAGRSPPTFTMAPGRGRGDEMQPHPPAVPPHPAQPLLPENAWKNSGVRGQAPPRVGHSFPAHRTGREPGPALSPEMKGEGPARPPPQPGGAAGPPGGHRGHRGGLVPD